MTCRLATNAQSHSIDSFFALQLHRYVGASDFARFVRDFNGMTFRGLQQSVPVGFLLLLYGYGWLPLVSGSTLGAIYEGGHYVTWESLPPGNISKYIQDNFSQTAMAEFLTGFWTWTVFASVLLAHRRHPDTGLQQVNQPRIGPRSEQSRTNKCGACLVTSFHIAVVLFELLLAVSCVSYGMVQQSDVRNKDQSLIGLLVSLAGVVSIHIAWRTMWCRKSGHVQSNQPPVANTPRGTSHPVESTQSQNTMSYHSAETPGNEHGTDSTQRGHVRGPLIARTLSEEFTPATIHDLSDVLSPAFTREYVRSCECCRDATRLFLHTFLTCAGGMRMTRSLKPIRLLLPLPLGACTLVQCHVAEPDPDLLFCGSN